MTFVSGCDISFTKGSAKAWIAESSLICLMKLVARTSIRETSIPVEVREPKKLDTLSNDVTYRTN